MIPKWRLNQEDHINTVLRIIREIVRAGDKEGGRPVCRKNDRSGPAGPSHSLVSETWDLVRSLSSAALLPCPLTPDTRLLLPVGSRPAWVVPPEGNEHCSGKSAPKPQPAHILAVGSRHQSLFTGAIVSIKESCCAPQAKHAWS